MSAVKRKLEDILTSMRLEERICFLIDVCGYSSEDAEEYALLYENDD